MHKQSTYTPHLQHIQSEAHLESSQTSAVELFCGNSQRIKAIGCFPRRAPSWMFDRTLNATLPNNSLHLHQTLVTLTGMFEKILRNVWQNSPEYLRIFSGIFEDIPRNVWRHSTKRNIPPPPSPIPHGPCIPLPFLVFLVLYIAVFKVNNVDNTLLEKFYFL